LTATIKIPGSGASIQEVDEELWSTECTVDELGLELCKVKKEITIYGDFFYVNGKPYQTEKRLAVRKYYLQARKLMNWIPIARPVPEFVIMTRDLSPKVIKELEDRLGDPNTLTYILKQAVGHIFENIDFRYYHLSIARNLKVRLEP
jgi:hypothetical protein